MKTVLRVGASLLAATAFALVAVASGMAGSPHATYTCVKVTNGETEVRVAVPEPAVGGLTNAGFTCVPESSGGGSENEEENEDQSEGPGTNEAGSQAQNQTFEHAEPRTVFCSTVGLAFRANGDGMGIALNLFASQGALLVELGLAAPAIFYEGVGASCDVLPGFVYSGQWVDNVGDVVPGVAVYPYYVPTGA